MINEEHIGWTCPQCRHNYAPHISTCLCLVWKKVEEPEPVKRPRKKNDHSKRPDFSANDKGLSAIGILVARRMPFSRKEIQELAKPRKSIDGSLSHCVKRGFVQKLPKLEGEKYNRYIGTPEGEAMFALHGYKPIELVA